MTKQNFDINKLRVASPCSVSWETMTGDERARHCHSCQLNIYNTAEMTESEVENLIAKREGRLCIRLYKRADGTVLTKDCPVGLRAYQKRVARFAGAALTAILGLFSASFGQKEETKITDASNVKISETAVQNEKGTLTGKITDPYGAVIAKAKLTLKLKDGKRKISSISNDEGEYKFSSLSEGLYWLEINSKGFKRTFVEIRINSGKIAELDVALEIDGGNVTVGIYAEEPLIDPTSSSVKTTITSDMFNKLPH